MSRRLIFALVVVVAVVAAGAWLATGGAGSQAGSSPAPSLGPVPESTTVTADARAVPVSSVELAAPGAGGVVAEVLAAEGATVTAGQPLLRLEGDRLAAEVAAAEAGVATADAGVAAAEATLDTARAGVDQAQAGVQQASAGASAANALISQASAGVRAADANRDQTPSGTKLRRAANAEVDRAVASLRGAQAQAGEARRGEAAARAAVDTARTEVERARAGLASARAQRSSAEAQLAAAKAAVDDLVLVAPMAGTLATLDAVVGETLSPGLTVARIADPSAWRFETVDLDETSIGRIREGADATISVDAFPDAEIAARVGTIDLFGQSSTGDIVYTVVLDPTGEVPEGLRWNMTASAQIDTGQ